MAEKLPKIWWGKIRNSTTRFGNLKVVNPAEKDTRQLGQHASCSMKLQVNIQEGDVMVSVGDTIVYVTPTNWKDAG